MARNIGTKTTRGMVDGHSPQSVYGCGTALGCFCGPHSISTRSTGKVGETCGFRPV